MTDDDLKKRIASAKSRHDEATGRSEPDRVTVDGEGMGQAMRVGVELVSAIGVGTFIGYWIDRWLDCAPFGMIVFFFLGFAAGFMNIYKMQTKNYHKTGLGQLTEGEKNGEKGSEK